jgi:eukaryotic-like serine/threonine-protein kinase
VLLAGPSKVPIHPSSWSRDGRYLLFMEGNDVLVRPMTGKKQEQKPFVYLKTQFREDSPQFSPDGKWVAYVSNESGRNEIYIQPFPATGGKWQVSNSGATEPRWRDDEKEIFFLKTGGALSSAGLRISKDTVEIEPARALTDVANFPGPDYIYDVARDGQRFLIIQQSDHAVIDKAPLTVVSDWQAALKN